MGIYRICKYCKSKEPSNKYEDGNPTEKMEINLENIHDYVYYKEATYHKECFEKARLRFRHKLSEKELEAVLEDSEIYLKNTLVTGCIYGFMLENYNITTIDKRVFQKIRNINSGSLNGMSVGIPVEDLIDMWQKKIGYLNKVHNQNASKGKEIKGNNRILYDLSVLVNRYDGYLEWKKEQQILQAHNEISKSKNPKVNLTLLEKQITKQNSIRKDFNNLLEEMF